MQTCKTISTVTSENFSSHFERSITRLSAYIDLKSTNMYQNEQCLPQKVRPMKHIFCSTHYSASLTVIRDNTANAMFCLLYRT
jgi:sensor c-di-GMP phosphodiesterase-like protein